MSGTALVFWVTLTLNSFLVESKVQIGSITLGGASLDQHRGQFVSKFGYTIGRGSYDVRFRLRSHSTTTTSTIPASIQSGIAAPRRTPALEFGLFLDEDWPDVEASSDCSAQVKLSRKKTHYQLGSLGEWGRWESGEVKQSIRPHIWYFMIFDCKAKLGDATAVLDYEINFKQPDGSEFSVEMRYMLTWNVLALVALTCFLLRYGARCWGFWCSAGALHGVIWVLTAAAALQYAAQVLHTMHLWRYQQDGVGLWTLDAFGEIFFMLSQVVQTTLFIAIAMGYTLLPAAAGQVGFVQVVALFTLGIHAALVGFAKLQGEASCKYHENEGAVGWVLLTVRLMLYAWFVYAGQSSQRKAGLRLQCFLQRFQLAGALYFLAYPTIFVVVQLFAPYLQHPIMQIGLLIMQTASVIWFAELFLERGAYFKVSSLSSSLLPGVGHAANFGVNMGLGTDKTA
mmetsp:Transcript_112295/g.194700  ORF Transcript_112295/g.194700 Transcript_112295/m.194700 type:complete len:454 (-) Transcript_112295:30-1391(-)